MLHMALSQLLLIQIIMIPRSYLLGVFMLDKPFVNWKTPPPFFPLSCRLNVATSCWEHSLQLQNVSVSLIFLCLKTRKS